jgi:Holliday junction resolvase RusA-like endonuclease
MIRVYGTPKPQPRSNACMRGKHAGVYTPSGADSWKLAVAAAWVSATPYTVPLRLSIEILAPRPKRLTTKKASPWRLAQALPGDVDNYAKAVMDALTMAGAWVDDVQVVDLRIRKCYAAKGEAPGAEIELEEVSP